MNCHSVFGRLLSLAAGVGLSLPAAAFAQDVDFPDEAHAAVVSHMVDRRSRDLLGLLENWRAATGTAKSNLEPAVTALAVERRGYLVESMGRAPDEAWQAVLFDDDRADVDLIAPGNTAVGVVVEGSLSINVAEALDQGISVTLYDLTLDDGSVVHLRPALGTPDELRSGSRIAVSGWQIDDEVLFDANAGTSLVTPPGTFPPPTMTYLAVRVDTNFATLPEGVTKSAIEGVYNGSAQSVRDFFLETSDGNLTLDVSVHQAQSASGKLLVNDLISKCDHLEILSKTVAALYADGGSLGGFDGLVIFMDWINTPQQPDKCQFFNRASTGPVTVQIPTGGSVDIGVAWMGSYHLQFHPNVHEIGHTLGAGHAQFWDCTDTTKSQPGGCICNYGDPMAAMGGRVKVEPLCHTFGSPTANWNGVQALEVTHWLDTTRALDVICGATANYTLAPIASTASAPQLLKIPRGFGDSLYIEFRTEVGAYDTTGMLSRTNADGGAAMLYISPTPYLSAIIDPHATGGATPDVTTSALRVGESYTDPCSNATVTILGIANTEAGPRMNVRVSFGTCCPDKDPPTVTMKRPLDNAIVSGNVPLKAEATDIDSTIDYVSFFVRETNVGTVTTPIASNPNVYRMVWDSRNVPNGNYQIFATATDEPGAGCCPNTGLSNSITVRVKNATIFTKPVTGITGPLGSSSMTLPFPVTASASAGDGIATVEYWLDPTYTDPCGAGEFNDGIHPADCKYHAFFPAYSRYFADVDGGRGAFFLGSAQADPFTLGVDSLPPGSYQLWSRAYDNTGQRTDSESVPFTVTGSTDFAVSFPFDNGAPIQAGSTIVLEATVTSDPNEVGYVDFFVGETYVGSDAVAPYGVAWTIPDGIGVTHLIRASAYGIGGRTAVETTTMVSQ